MSEPAFQDLIPHNHCWGCGPRNEHGLHVKSHWDGEESVCRWQPAPWFAAGPLDVLNGGIIATIIDCHCVCTAIAAYYRAEGRPIISEPRIWCATASLTIDYLQPTPLDAEVVLRAQIEEQTDRKTVLRCSLHAGEEQRARARVVAVRVPLDWGDWPGSPDA